MISRLSASAANHLRATWYQQSFIFRVQRHFPSNTTPLASRLLWSWRRRWWHIFQRVIWKVGWVLVDGLLNRIQWHSCRVLVLNTPTHLSVAVEHRRHSSWRHLITRPLQPWWQIVLWIRDSIVRQTSVLGTSSRHSVGGRWRMPLLVTNFFLPTVWPLMLGFRLKRDRDRINKQEIISPFELESLSLIK